MKFKNAPLVQVVAKATLKDLYPLTPMEMAEIFAAMKERYPVFHDFPVLDAVPGRVGIVETPAQVHGLFFAGPGKPNAATVQADMVTTRWARQSRSEALPYPGFRHLASELEYVVRAVTHAEDSDLSGGAAVAQLAYTDLVIAPGMTLSDFADAYLTPNLIPVPTNKSHGLTDYNIGWSTEEADFRLTITQKVFQPQLEGEAIEGIEAVTAYAMEWVSGSGLKEGQSLAQALDLLHVEIEGLFTSSITKYAKDEWGYIESD